MSDAEDDAVLEQRLAGKSTRAIGRELKLTVGQVDAILDRVLPAVDNPARLRAIALDLHRLDGLLETFYKRAIAGDVNSGTLCVKIIERRAFALGLDAPTKLDVISIQAQKTPTGHQKIFEAIMRVKYGPQWKPGDGDGSIEQPPDGNGKAE
jgi:hypothetical protein